MKLGWKLSLKLISPQTKTGWNLVETRVKFQVETGLKLGWKPVSTLHACMMKLNWFHAAYYMNLSMHVLSCICHWSWVHISYSILFLNLSDTTAYTNLNNQTYQASLHPQIFTDNWLIALDRLSAVPDIDAASRSSTCWKDTGCIASMQSKYHSISFKTSIFVI